MYEKENPEVLITKLEQIRDPRKARGVRYRFADLLLMCIYSVLSGYSEATEIEGFVELRFDYFQELIHLEKVPSHDTFSRVMRYTNFEELMESLGSWVKQSYPELYERYSDRKVLHVDGKAVRAAREKSNGENPIYLLNAMYAGGSIEVEVDRIDAKHNEITALPNYLKQFNLKDTVVTIDAIGCCASVIEAIRKQGGNYLMPVKENQPRLNAVIKDKIAQMIEDGSYKMLDCVSERKQGHGRIEKTEFRLIKDTSFLYEELGTASFYGSIARIGVMDKTVEQKKDGSWTKATARTILITDIEDKNFTADAMYRIKQSHWDVEAQHWILDVQLREDRATARRDYAVQNGAILRRFCMMVRKHDEEYAKKPFKRFLQANVIHPERIENLLFNRVVNGIIESDK